MRKRRMILVILVVIIIIGAGLVVYITSPSWLPRSTSLAISPSTASIQTGAAPLALTASVKYGTALVSGGTISWQVTGGSLDRTTGTSVVFTPPSVTSNASITITASFSGTGVYQASSATSQITVSAAKPKTTVLTLSRTTFALHGGNTLALNATLSPSGAPSGLIAWTLTPANVGSLSSTTGPSVTYTAPSVQQNTNVTIIASFAGNAQYTASSANSTGSILPPTVVAKTSTVVSVSPSSFSVESNGTLGLTASVKDASSGKPLTVDTISWALTPANFGSLSATTGTSVTYTAPPVQLNTTVTITASFAGNSTYLGDSGSSTGVVTPPSVLSYVYTIAFDSASMTNVRFTGPITMNGTSVTLLTADSATMTGFSLSRFGLNASSMQVNGLYLYVSYVKTYSTTFNGAIDIKGGESVNMGPAPSATFGNGTMYVVRMEGTSADFAGMTSVSQYVGGSEPYVPSIITSPSVLMSNIYSITGPATWEQENNMVTNITTGKIYLPQFVFSHPISYTLDRHDRTFTATGMWALTASNATALDVSAFTVYFQVTGGEMVVVTATGSDNINNMIPFGLNTGGSFNGIDVTVQPVSFSASQLTLGSFVLSIV